MVQESEQVVSPLCCVPSSTIVVCQMTKNQGELFCALPRSLVTCFYRYSTFVRVGSGLSYADYVWLRQKPWKVWDPKNPPEFLQTSKRGREDKCDAYIEPAECALPCRRDV